MDLPLVLVTWKDANVGGDDAVTLENVASYHKPTIVTTLGWLLKSDAEGVTLVNEFYDNIYRGRTFIYAPMVVSIEFYSLAKKRKKNAASLPPDASDSRHSKPRVRSYEPEGKDSTGSTN